MPFVCPGLADLGPVRGCCRLCYLRATPGGSPPATPAPTAPPAADAARGRGTGVAIQTMDVAAFPKTFPALGAKANSEIRLLWIVCGTADSLIGVNRQFKDWLKSKNIQFTEQEVPDVGHVWPLWRQNVADLAPRLFQSKGK